MKIYKLIIRILLLVIICFLSLVDCVFAVSGNDLVENANKYDGELIEFTGEVIGDIMRRGDFAWININDGERAIGVFTDKSLINEISTIGSYNYVGDKIKIIGTFNRACSKHGGDLDIHASSIVLISPGFRVSHPVNQNKLLIAAALFIGILAVLIVPAIIKKIRS